MKWKLMTVGTNIAANVQAELLGDPHPLLEQLGPAEDLALATDLSAAVQFRRVTDLPTLRSFLDAYRTQVLIPLELPVIVSAYGHALRSEVRELIALDARLAAEPVLRDFAVASCRVGQRQLGKLRPMRDERLVQRYLTAIEAGEARGWHTLVYGVSLATFSIALRQGLQNYARQTIQGFIGASARSLRLSEAACESFLAEQTGHVPRGIELAIAANSTLTFG